MVELGGSQRSVKVVSWAGEWTRCQPPIFSSINSGRSCSLSPRYTLLKNAADHGFPHYQCPSGKILLVVQIELTVLQQITNSRVLDFGAVLWRAAVIATKFWAQCYKARFLRGGLNRHIITSLRFDTFSDYWKMPSEVWRNGTRSRFKYIRQSYTTRKGALQQKVFGK